MEFFQFKPLVKDLYAFRYLHLFGESCIMRETSTEYILYKDHVRTGISW